MQAYRYSSYDEASSEMHLSSVDALEAYTPYVLHAEGGYSGTVSGTVDPEQYPEAGYVEDGCLCGAIAEQTVTIDDNACVLQNLSAGVQFYKVAEMLPGRMYIRNGEKVIKLK